jgi:hypothetical protein
MILVGGAVALAFAAFAPSSEAGAPKIDVSGSTIQCNTVFGTAQIKPGLVNGGTATATQITVKGTIDGCTVTSGNSAIIVKSSFSGKLGGTSNDCSGLLGANPVSGTITVKWKSDKTTPLLQTSSIITPGNLAGNLFTPGAADPDFGAMALGKFKLGPTGSSVSGAFAGGSGQSTTSAATSQDVATILGACGTTKGVSALNLGFGTMALG